MQKDKRHEEFQKWPYIVIQQDAGCCFVSAKIVVTVSKSLDTCCCLLLLAMHACQQNFVPEKKMEKMVAHLENHSELIGNHKN